MVDLVAGDGVRKEMVVVVLLLALLNGAWAGLNPKNVVYAVNCGGPALKTKDGVRYEADSGFSSGLASDYGLVNFASIRNTKDSELYQTERYDTQTFSYQVPVPSDGVYTLVLKFSEVYFSSEGEKIFNVRLGDVEVISDLDIFAKVGKGAAYDEFVEFTVLKNQLYINGQLVQKGLTAGKLTVDFVKGFADNPKVNAIALVKGTKEDTEFLEQKAKLESIARQKEKLVEQRSEPSDDTEDYEVVEGVIEHRKEEASLLELVFSTPGVILLGILSLSLALVMRGGPSKAKQS